MNTLESKLTEAARYAEKLESISAPLTIDIKVKPGYIIIDMRIYDEDLFNEPISLRKEFRFNYISRNKTNVILKEMKERYPKIMEKYINQLMEKTE